MSVVGGKFPDAGAAPGAGGSSGGGGAWLWPDMSSSIGSMVPIPTPSCLGVIQTVDSRGPPAGVPYHVWEQLAACDNCFDTLAAGSVSAPTPMRGGHCAMGPMAYQWKVGADGDRCWPCLCSSVVWGSGS